MFRWAIVSNSTVSPLVHRLRKHLEARDIPCEFFVSEHGDAARQVFSPESELYTFKPDMVALHFDLPQVKPTIELSVAFETLEDRQKIVSEVTEYVDLRLNALRSNTAGVLLVNTFRVIPRTALGIGLDQIYRNTVRSINLNVSRAAASLQQCYVLDYDSLWAEVGFQEYDRRFDCIAQFPMGAKMQQLLVDEWMRYFRAVQGLSRKCIVVDLDNTLWGGILGEDGSEGIRMSDTPEGRPFRRFQQALKALARRGILLAVNSKNNLEEVTPVFRQHPDLLLRESDFAAMQINWDDKATNLARISRELNIGLQHMVFLDDSAAERAWVRERHPEVLVPEMPEDKAYYTDVLCKCELDTLAITQEDLKRADMYRDERQRQILRAEAPSFEEFLRNLNLEVEIEALRPQMLDRAGQLCQRTNQFNLTTRRHNADQLRKYAESPESKVLMMKARDRFGEYGWSGMAIILVEANCLLIESFLLSCRILGKNAEFALFAAVMALATQRSCTRLRGTYIPTSKNGSCKDFFQRCGLTPSGGAFTEALQVFEANLSELFIKQIEHIKVSMNL